MFTRSLFASPDQFRIFPLLPEDPPEGAAGGGDAKPTPPAAKPEEGKTFTQADLDRVVADRLTRERARFADYDDLKAAKAKLDEHEAANATELEKATKKAREEGEAAARSAVTRDRVLDKIEVAAAGKFRDVTDARLRLAERASEFVGKDGSIDTTAIDAAVVELLKNAPHLKSAGTGRPLPDEAQGGAGGTGQRAQAGLEEARRRGFIKN